MTAPRLVPLAALLSIASAVALTACAPDADTAQPPAPPAAQPDTDAARAPEAALSTEVYNPGASGIFAVTSVLITGPTEAVLVDAQFSTADARKLVELVRASGKTLTTIYISHSDPDYYFGLEALREAFPDARIVATPPTIAHIEASRAGKLAFWGPQLGDNAPRTTIVPEPLQGDTLTVDGQDLKIIGLDGATPDRTFVWMPATRTVLGGIPVLAGEHVWMADTQTPESHAHWLATLDAIKALQPERVIPGHFAAGAPQDLAAVDFTAGYIRAFDEEAAQADTAADLIQAMQARYPGLAGEASLETSAKVAKGEMQWP